MEGEVGFGRVAIIGLGLIGGSLGLALRRSGAVDEVVGVDLSASVLARAEERGLIDRGTTDPGAGVAGAEVVVTAVPVGSFGAVLAAARPGLAEGVLVTDVGSVKAPVIAEAETLLPETATFVGGHPLAGTEDSGVEAALDRLFQKALCILTPTPATPARDLERAKALWTLVGSEVVTMEPREHDRVLAATSHLPHMMAFTLIRTFGDLDAPDHLARFAAGGFRDLTRIAGSDPIMWRDIALANSEPLLEMLDRFEERLEDLRQAIAAGDGTALESFFREARALRRGLPPRAHPDEEQDEQQ
ncbi:MAG TPA: prephenate dehydrogenase/arogenate dehydrogenase family protein [Gammaproteobacteria bacterium]|nr:prephenate dehydrogenase/arogenate dehydrogenase family protein [Gammaproteobacteria bacterium]